MKKSDFYYALPPNQIAQSPLPKRTDSRLLVVPAEPAPLHDATFSDIVSLLRQGDLLVFNDTRVIPARLHGAKASGGRVELFIERIVSPQRLLAQIRASKPPKPGTQIRFARGGRAQVLERDERGFYWLSLALDPGQTVTQWLDQTGEIPLPPYVKRPVVDEDHSRYQTVFSRHAGAVAAPTAGLHFDHVLLGQLQDKGVECGYLTLHVGAGTFQPIRVELLQDHVMHHEWCQVSAPLIAQIERTRQRGGRVIGVGTTVVRALESALDRGRLCPFCGQTQLFIIPGYQITTVDLLLTNFHLPESSLLMLVSAFAGRQRILNAYQYAIDHNYRFFSYGDAMLLFPQSTPRAVLSGSARPS